MVHDRLPDELGNKTSVRDLRDLDDIMQSAAIKMETGDDPGPMDYHAADATPIERVVAVLTDFTQEVERGGLLRWVSEKCLPDPKVLHAFASIVGENRHLDPHASDFLLALVDSARVFISESDRLNGRTRCGASRRYRNACLDLVWREHACLAVMDRIGLFLQRTCQTWRSDQDPFSGQPAAHATGRRRLMRPGEGLIRYPDLRIGLTAAGRSCAVVSRQIDTAFALEAWSVIGTITWAMWEAGISQPEIRRFSTEMAGEIDVNVVSRWINVDGDGMAGAERLRFLVDTPHPWVSLFGMSPAKAKATRLVFCAHREQAVGVLKSLGGHAVGAVYYRQGPPGVLLPGVPAVSSVAEVEATLASMAEIGMADVVLALEGEIEDGMAAAIARAVKDTRLAIVGAGPSLRALVKAEWVSSPGYDETAFVATGRYPVFGGAVLH